MSCIFVVIPMIAGGWPVVAPLAAAAAAALGLANLAKTGARAGGAVVERVDLPLESVEGLAGMTRADERVEFGDDRLRVIVMKDARGQCRVCVEGTGRTREELDVLGRRFAERMIQQYAYAKVAQELRSEGFSIAKEEVGADRSIRIRFRKGV